MSETISYGTNIGGVSQSTSITRTGTTLAHSETPTAGKSGTLTTRTNNSSGVLTVTSHGWIDSYKLDIGWANATSGLNEHRARVDISSVTTDTITFSGGTGNDLPVVDSSVTVGRRHTASASFTGSSMKMLSIRPEPPSGQTDSRAIMAFIASDADAKVCDVASNEKYVWHDNGPESNPVSGYTISSLEFSSLTTQAPAIAVQLVYDASP